MQVLATLLDRPKDLGRCFLLFLRFRGLWLEDGEVEVRELWLAGSGSLGLGMQGKVSFRLA